MNTVPVTGIWLRTVGDYIEVMAEVDGTWRVVIREYAPLREQTISHCAHPDRMRTAPIWEEAS